MLAFNEYSRELEGLAEPLGVPLAKGKVKGCLRIKCERKEIQYIFQDTYEVLSLRQ